MRYKIVLIVLCGIIGTTFGQLRCYTCSFTSVDSEQVRSSCLNANNETTNTDCQYRYCTILRQEFIDPPGVIASFLRGCDDEPDFLNHEVVDFSYRTFYRACTNDLCNIGNGIQSITGGELRPSPDYTGDNLLVPGTGGSAASSKISMLVFVLVIMIINIL